MLSPERFTTLYDETRRMRNSNKKVTYVAHKPRPDGNMILPISPGPGCSLRLLVTSLKTASNLAALYLCLTPSPKRNVETIRGYPKTSCPSRRYSNRQSGMVIRNRPSIIAIRLYRFLADLSERRAEKAYAPVLEPQI